MTIIDAILSNKAHDSERCAVFLHQPYFCLIADDSLLCGWRVKVLCMRSWGRQRSGKGWERLVGHRRGAT